MFDRPDSQEQRCALVHIRTGNGEDPTRQQQEFRDLATSAGATVATELSVVRRTPDPKLYIGSGKAEELAALVNAYDCDLVLVDQSLSPSQERNLERLLKARVLDRTGLILDIFAQRARSFEGKLQVELAQLRHLSTRLVRGWTHLERQKGGIGLRGPGETQLETDRRLIGGRIKQLRKRLEKVGVQRGQGRRARDRAGVPTVSLVGYTNAGKSTLFNRLTESGVYAADQLFATLDTTLRRIDLPRTGRIVLTDTVGFVRDLPHELVAAFRSTLEETTEADLLLHVIDASDASRDDNIAAVDSVLDEIGAEGQPQIQVMNKIDQMDDRGPGVERNAEGQVIRVWLSAQSGDGMGDLLGAIDEYLEAATVVQKLSLPPGAGRIRAQLYQLGHVVNEESTEQGGWLMEVELEPMHLARLEQSADFAGVTRI